MQAHAKYGKETVALLCLVLPLLRWRYFSTGVEDGYHTDNFHIWFCDDGSIEYGEPW